MSRRWIAGAALLLVPAAGACRDAGAEARFAGSVDTLANGVVHVRNPATGMWKPGEEWTLVEDLRIGSEDSEGPEMFGAVAALEVDAAGRIYVLEPQARQVRVFDADGTHVRSFGRKGGGPGEFEGPAGLMWDSAGRLWTVDQQLGRFSVFDTAGTFVTSHMRPAGFMMMPWPGGMDRSGRLYDVGLLPGGGFRHALLRYDSAMQPRDTFRFPEFEAEAFTYEDAKKTKSMSMTVPFTPSRAWRMDGEGNVWTGVSDRYRMARLNFRGDTVRIVEKEFEAVPVSSEDRDSALAKTKWFTEQGGKVDASRIPSRKPAYEMLAVDDRDFLWVAPMVARAEQRRRFDVFDAEGRYLGRVASPEALTLSGSTLIRGDRIYAVVLDEMDIPYVVRYRIQGRKA